MSALLIRNVQVVANDGWRWLIVLVAAFNIAGCDGTSKAPPSKRIANDPLWSQFIAERTAGQVSKYSKIQVRFVNDVIRPEKWKDSAAISGPPGLRLIKGFHDEVLSGEWRGYRSSRIGLQWRVIYRIDTDHVLFQVASITAHD